MNLAELMVLAMIPLAILASVVASLCQGDKSIAFALCFFFGPFGAILVLAADYAMSIKAQQAKPVQAPKSASRN